MLIRSIGPTVQWFFFIKLSFLSIPPFFLPGISRWVDQTHLGMPDREKGGIERKGNFINYFIVHWDLCTEYLADIVKSITLLWTNGHKQSSLYTRKESAILHVINYFHQTVCLLVWGQSSFALYFKRCTEKQIGRANNKYIYVKAQRHIFTTCPVWWI